MEDMDVVNRGWSKFVPYSLVSCVLIRHALCERHKIGVVLDGCFGAY